MSATIVALTVTDSVTADTKCQWIFLPTCNTGSTYDTIMTAML